MDELPETTSPPPALPTTNRRDTLQSLLTTDRPRSPQAALSNSEPSLRFPRPQGNRRLANWVSTSNPDMMDVTTAAEESALAESAYELITPVDHDLHDPHDDQYTGSVSESVGSLEFQPPDDVHSLAGTEHTYDEESILDDDAEPLSRSMIHEEAVDVHNGNHAPLQEESDAFDSEAVPGVEEEAAELEEARSRDSLQYTTHSLKTPSILTPEASKIIEIPSSGAAEKLPVAQQDQDDLNDQKDPPNHRLTTLHDAVSQFWDYTAGAVSAVLPGMIFAAVFTLLINLLYPSPVQFANDSRPVATSTILATTTPLAIYTSRSTSATTRPSRETPTQKILTQKAPTRETPTRETPTQQPTTSVKGTGLIVLNERVSDDWLFGSKKPDIRFTPQGQGVITVHVAPDVTHAWLKKRGCLSITADRDTQPAKLTYLASSDGFSVKFPQNETHGLVTLTIQATCRPLVVKAVKIHFGKGIMEEAYEMTKNIASDISALVPVAAHEAEKCLAGAKKSLNAVSDQVASSVSTASDNLLCSIKASAYRVQELVGKQPWSVATSAQDMMNRWPRFLESVRAQLTQQLKAAPALKTSIEEKVLSAQLRLVTTQISAKMWWLGITGQKNKRDEYGQKAKTYMDGLRAQGRNKIRRPQPHHVRNSHQCFWSKRGRCKKQT
ncbi:hypothetical protein E4U54_004885 [Claviceps lovelessii]|nr:hypothetical protein E4U54_004885 [Claviceps lovelessii]